jgi:hypothetical protein
VLTRLEVAKPKTLGARAGQPGRSNIQSAVLGYEYQPYKKWARASRGSWKPGARVPGAGSQGAGVGREQARRAGRRDGGRVYLRYLFWWGERRHMSSKELPISY